MVWRAVAAHNKRDCAREELHKFWKAVSEYSAIFSPVQQTPREHGTAWVRSELVDGRHNAFDLMSRVLSPYELNPLNVNPLRSVLENQIDIERIHAANDIALFVTATSAETVTSGCDIRSE